MSFTESARRLAGLAGVLLRWTPDVFWRATPAELGCVVRALSADGSPGAGTPPDRVTIAALIKAFPDG